MARTSHTRGKDQAREMDEAAQSASRVWRLLRSRFPKAVRERVDAVAEAGGLSLHDIELLEFAAHEVLEERVRRLSRRKNTASAVTKLLSVQLQSRKHMRTLREAMSPIKTPNESSPKLPRAIGDRLVVKDSDKSDLGDDLVN